MKNIYIRSLLCGFALGTVLFTIAPLGLAIGFVELLRPVLVPGIMLAQLLLGNGFGVLTIFLSVVLNGLVFSLVFLAAFSWRAQNKNS